MPNERRGGGPVSSRTADIEPPSASTRSVTLPGYVPPPRPQGPKSVRSRQRCSEAVIAGPGTCQWRPLEQLVGPPTRTPPPPSVRPTTLTIPPPPTTLTIPPPPSSLQGLADSTGPNAAAQNPLPSRPPPRSHRARSFALAIFALAVGVGIGAAVVQRGELRKSAAKAPPPSFERHSVVEAAAVDPPVVVNQPSPIEIALDDEAEGRKDPLARRRAAQRALSKTIERPSDILPEFPFPDESKPATPTAPAIKKSKRELAEEAKEAKDLAAAQLESLL